jgi:hypothetical protein
MIVLPVLRSPAPTDRESAQHSLGIVVCMTYAEAECDYSALTCRPGCDRTLPAEMKDKDSSVVSSYTNGVAPDAN